MLAAGGMAHGGADEAPWRVALTGLSLGAVHVLTGPDHLSALVALASGQEGTKALVLGVQWGGGHALGILIVAGACLALGHVIDFGETVHALLNYLIGAFLILLGVWTFYHAHVEYEAKQKPPSKWDSVQCQDASYTLLSADDIEYHASFRGKVEAFFTSHAPDSVSRVQRSASICVGVLHGVAGPGGVLGVLPVVSLHNSPGHAAIYLACFCGSSILCMGAFAAFYGEATRRSGSQSALMAYRVACVSSAVSVAVGVVWIALQVAGVLDHVFGHHH